MNRSYRAIEVLIEYKLFWKVFSLVILIGIVDILLNKLGNRSKFQ